jgi:glycerophosphoryl diester phosphodiesterase
MRVWHLTLLAACSAPSQPPDRTCTADQNFLCGRIRNIAHRGGAALAPENTLPAFANAVAIGADILEMDVRRTSDGIVILLHDSTVDRTTDGTGAANALTYAQIQALDAGYQFTRDNGATYPYRGTGVRIPTLAEVLAAHPDRYFMIEIKDSVPTVAPVLEGIDSIRDRVLIASFFDEVLAEVRTRAPDVLTTMSLAEMVAFNNLTDADEADYVVPAPFIQPPHEQIEDPTLERAKRKGILVHPWTVDDRNTMIDLVTRGVDGIITDDPALLRDALATPRTW